MIYFLAVPLALVSFLFQIRPRIRNRYFGIDTWRHLAVAESYRQRRRSPNAVPERYLIPESSDYPPLLRLALSVLPKSAVERAQWFIGPLIDLVHNLLVFVVAYQLTGQPAAALAAQVAYMFAPLVVMENSSLTTRPIASLMFSGLMLANFGFASTGEWAWFPLSASIATLLFLTHRMGIQALAAISLILSAWFLTPYYAAAVAGGWALAVFVSKGYYWRVFTGHLAMLNWWRKNIHNRYAHQVRGLPQKGQDSADAVFRLYQMVRKAPFAAVFAANPFVIFPIAAALDWGLGLGLTGPVQLDPRMRFFVVWSLGLLVLGIVIRQLRALEFIGEGERYGEYAAFSSGIVVAGLLSSTSPQWQSAAWAALAAVAIFGGLLPSLFLQQNVVAKDKDRSLTPALAAVLAELDRCQVPPKLMTIPLSLADFALYFSRAKVLSTDSSLGHLRYYSDFFPVLKVPITEVFDRFEIDHLLINENYVTIAELGLAEEMVKMRSGQFCLLMISPTVPAR